MRLPIMCVAYIIILSATSPLPPFQLSMLSGIFPRHVIEFISLCSMKHAGPGGGPASPGPAANSFTPELMGQLARTHDDVTVLFMDIVGERGAADVGAGRQALEFGARFTAPCSLLPVSLPRCVTPLAPLSCSA